MFRLSVLLTLAAALTLEVRGHGRLMDPPARSSMWRKGFQNVPRDYSDNQLFCGGFPTQWKVNGGKCGVCGDPYGGPYEHEVGGKYYTDVIAGQYMQGQVFDAEVELTASHKGWFEFRLCVPNDKNEPVTHTCLDQNLLPLADGSGTRYAVTTPGHVFHQVALQLPSAVTCDFCVLQWKYHTGNSWGTDPDGTGCIGCGPQEEFYGCANIAITASGETPKPPATPGPGTPPTQATRTPAPWTPAPATPGPATPAPWTPAPATPAPATPSPPTTGCRPAIGPWYSHPGMAKWCRENCARGFCPATHCTCSDTVVTPPPPKICRAAEGPWQDTPNMDQWCQDNCAKGNCPATHCTCTETRREARAIAALNSNPVYKKLVALLQEAAQDSGRDEQ